MIKRGNGQNEISQLVQGENLRGLNGLVQVQKVTPTFVDKPVYNFEVQGEHIYHIGESGFLAHNTLL